MRLLSTLLSALLGLLALTYVAPARADDPAGPEDVSPATFNASALPPAPDGFVSEQDGAVRWDYPESASALVRELRAGMPSEWLRLERELGADVDDALVIRVGRDPAEMEALAPAIAPPPAYAVGVAYPASGLVLLTLSAPETWERPAVPQVLTHELSHVALHRAAQGRALPRWFVEGVAIHQARERSFERMQTLWEATVRGTLMPLDDLSRSFPARAHRVSVAYAQSADFIEWLRRRGDGDARFAELVSRVGRGQSFETAISQTWSAGIGQLEHEWREGLAERYGALPLLLGSGAIWLVIGVLVVLAWLRRRRASRRTLEVWAREEAAEDARVVMVRSRAAATRMVVLGPRATAGAAIDAQGTTDADTRLDDALIDANLGREPDETLTATRDPNVPTIVWEGRSHTLH